MRRPHPRFDSRRNAWVTNAGGRLKVLAKGPENSETKVHAWDTFYEHMASLGRPVADHTAPILTVGELADEYGCWMIGEVAVARMASRTQDYYRYFIQSFLDAVGGNRPVNSLRSIELERFKSGRHSVQTIQRLFNWSVKMGLVESNPFKNVQRPQPGARQRILSIGEIARMMRATDRAFREFILAMHWTFARPQEVRLLQWKHLEHEPGPRFVLTEFKAKRLRKRSHRGTRKIFLDRNMIRLLRRLRRKRSPNLEDFVFLNSQGKPWTANAVRLRMRRLRDKVGLGPDESGENVVACVHLPAYWGDAGVRERRSRQDARRVDGTHANVHDGTIPTS